MKVGEIVGKFFMDSKRIFRVSRKPTKEEYKRMALIIGIGIIIIGIIGFLIQLIFTLLGIGGWSKWYFRLEQQWDKSNL